MRFFFLTFFYSGLSPKAPGTAGTILAAFFAFLILSFFSTQTLFLATILLSAIAVNQINIYEAQTNSHDDKRIVIDEVVGVWLAFCLSSDTLVQFICSIIYFRLFDILKPSIIGRVDRDVKGGLGVVGDDLLAGVFAGICSAATFQALGYFNFKFENLF